MLYGCPFEKIHFLPKIDTNSGFWRDWDTLSKKFNNGTFMALQMKVFNLKIFQIVWCCFQFRFLCFSINGTFFTPYYDYPLSLIVLPIGNPKRRRGYTNWPHYDQVLYELEKVWIIGLICWPLRTSTVTVSLLYDSRIVSQLAVHIVSMHRGMLLHANQERQLFISLRREQLVLLTSYNTTMETYKRPN